MVRQAPYGTKISSKKKRAVLLAVAAPSLAGCNTVTSAGEDITGGARLVGDAIGG
jgi:predicted small secreted protein